MSESPKSAKAEMLIRKPIEGVFEAFINPAVTTKFWFTKSSGKLEEGKQVTWTWEMYDLDVPVFVKEIIPNKKILIEWGEGEHLSTAHWEFIALDSSKTFVKIVNDNFLGTDIEVAHKVVDSTGGFTMVLAGLKAWLEHGVELNLIGDKFPKEMMNL